MLDECFRYDDVLRKNGHFAGGEALQGPTAAATLRWQNGQVAVTDGPYAETKEQIGGILILEARDLNHAIQLMSQHPGVKAGPFEIRPRCGPERPDPRKRATARGGEIERVK
ncbi:MAG: YciI family protein [Chthoniobacter sp.]